MKPDYSNSIVNLMSSIMSASGGKSDYKPLKQLPANALKAKNIILFVLDGCGDDVVK